jgi:predicted AlkP superfamily pyrophosphatase or phosphodiesterase
MFGSLSRRRWLATLLLTGAAMQPALAAETPKHRVIVFVWDGMRPDAINAQDTPNLWALGQRGTFFEDNHSTYPTFTMANASSFATGSFLGPNGFYGNRFWAPGTNGLNAKGEAVDFQQPQFTEDYQVLRDLDNHYQHELLELPTLLETAHKAGLSTAVVGKSGPVFLQDYREGGLILDENTALPLSFAKQLQAAGYPLPSNTARSYDADQLRLREPGDSPTEQGKLITLKDGVTADATAAAPTTPEAANAWLMKVYLEQILPQHRPDLSIVWLRNPDSTEHQYGVGTPEFHLALQAQDQLLGHLQNKLKALGLADSTDLIVVSDHAHSNVAGPRDLFPLRQINDGRVAGTDNEWGYSVSGAVRLADQLSQAGFTAFDGTGCLFVPVMSGLRADGNQLIPTHYDHDGRLCGKPGPYTTPSYKLPEQLPKGALVLAPNGGTEYLYQPEHDPALIARTVRYLQSREYIGAVFVAKRYGALPGTLPAEDVYLENAARGPDIIISYAFDADAVIQGFAGTEYSSMGNERGMHGSFSRIDVHNTLLAAGPSFRRGFRDPLPSGNVDLAPTIASVFGLSMPLAQGRPLREALSGAAGLPLESYRVNAGQLRSAKPAQGLQMQRIDGSALSATQYDLVLELKQLATDDQQWTYFDQAQSQRQ